MLSNASTRRQMPSMSEVYIVYSICISHRASIHLNIHRNTMHLMGITWDRNNVRWSSYESPADAACVCVYWVRFIVYGAGNTRHIISIFLAFAEVIVLVVYAPAMSRQTVDVVVVILSRRMYAYWLLPPTTQFIHSVHTIHIFSAAGRIWCQIMKYACPSNHLPSRDRARTAICGVGSLGQYVRNESSYKMILGGKFN